MHFDFSSIRFLRIAAVKASRRNRLRRLLLLLVRLLFVAILVVLFAQPFDKRDPFQAIWGPQARVHCWIDPTMSMDYRAEGGALYEIALGQVAMIDSVLAPAARLMCYDEARGEFVAREETGETYGRPRHGPSGIEGALTAFRRAGGTRGQMPVLVVFSDLQADIVARLDTLFGGDTLKLPVMVVEMGDKNPWNYTVSGGILRGDRMPVARAMVGAVGRDLDESELGVRFGGMRAGHKVVTCTRGETVAVEMDVSVPPGDAGGALHLVVADPFSHDNVDYFAGDQAAGKRVLVVSEGEESYPIVTALEALRSEQWRSPLVRRPEELTYEDIDSADVIVLSGIRESTRGLQSLLHSTGLGQKAVLFSPSTDPLLVSWNDQVLGYLGMTDARRTTVERPLHPVLTDTVSLLWRRFPRTSDRDVAVYQYHKSLAGTALLRLNNGDALAVTQTDDRGHTWIVMATPLGANEANNLCETGFFVPMLDRLVRHGLESLRRGGGQWYAGVPRRNPYYGGRSKARVFDSEGTLVADWELRQMVTLDRPGIYRVQPAGEPSYLLPVVVDPAERTFVYGRPAVPPVNRHSVRILRVPELREFLLHRRGARLLTAAWLALGALLLVEVFLWDWRKRGTERNGGE